MTASSTTLHSVEVLHVKYSPIAAISTTAVQHPLSVMYCRLEMKREAASGYKVGEYRIVSNLTDISNYPDTILNYLFTYNYTGQSTKYEFLLF